MTQTKEEVIKDVAETAEKIVVNEGYKRPLVDEKVRLSNDKKWVITTTTVTSIRSVNYFKKVLA